MSEKLSERRLVENEMIFRKLNEKVVQGLSDLKQLAFEHGQPGLAPDTTQPLNFYCECSSLDCTTRVTISPKDYEKIHVHDRDFVIATGHGNKDIEEVISSATDYDIVRKNRRFSHILDE